MHIAHRLRAADGFTLVETLTASMLLVVGVLGTFTFLTATVTASWNTRAREGAVTLARQISEDARSIPFAQLSPGTITGQLQMMPGLANSATNGSWQIQRLGITYTINASECSVDDPKDGYGVHDSTFCPDSSTQGTQDSNPVDMKRFTVDVSWMTGGLTNDFREVTTINSGGQASGLAATSLQLVNPAVANPTSPTISSPNVTQLQFSVSAPAGTKAIVWTVNGATQSWSATTSGTTWTSSPWTISGLSDGTYTVGAQAEDANGVIGPAVTIPVRLIRSVPSAPKAIAYGFDSNFPAGGKLITVAEFNWQANPELNVSGYRLYDPSGTLICTTNNSTSNYNCGATRAWCWTATTCVDLSPPSTTSPSLTYKVAPLYYDASNTLQQGPATSMTLTGTPLYTFSPTTADTGTNCSVGRGGAMQDMVSGAVAGTDTTQQSKPITFCSPTFGSGQTVGGGGTATVWLANTSPSSCSVSATADVDGNTSQGLTASNTLAPNSALAPYTFTFSSTQVATFNAGDRIDLSFSLCSGTALHYGSSSYPGQFHTQLQVPVAPTSLTVSPQSNGTAILSWSAPTSGVPVGFYRIYRGGLDYSDRYDTVDPSTSCSGGTCTYTDSHRSGSYSYYVTAVGNTTIGSNMAESTAIGPVTG